MKVLEVVGSLTFGGAETMVMNYYRHIPNDVCQIDFIVHAAGNDVYEKEVLSNGNKVFHIDTPGHVGAVKYINEVKKILLQNGPYDAIHAHTNTQEWMVMVAARLAGVPKRICHSHNTQFNTSEARVVFNRMLSNIFGNEFISCGQMAGRALYGNKAKFKVLNNAVEVSKFIEAQNLAKDEFRNKYNIAEDKIIIGHVGRFVKQKNHSFLIEAFQKAHLMNPNLLLVLFGDGPLVDDIIAKANELGINGDVIFAGTVSDMPKAYAMFDLFVLPSLHEGLPLTLIEAQCSALRILASDAITKECDLGLDQIKYLPLSIDVWSENMNVDRKDLVSQEYEFRIKEAAKLYDIEYQSKFLLQIYKREKE